jgi:hypothetical protein
MELNDGAKNKQIQLRPGHIIKIKPLTCVKVYLKKIKLSVLYMVRSTHSKSI